MSTDRKILSISIIIPALNEAESLASLLPHPVSIEGVEVIVADGGSIDRTVDTAKDLGAKILHSVPGRAVQMNAGAQAAQGDILLFLHADTSLPPGFAEQVQHALSQPGVAAGAFRLAIKGRGFGLRLIEWLANLRSRVLKMPYGDQGIFVRAGLFAEVGGFPALPIMEDFELVRRLKRKGSIRILRLTATTSPRRWENLGLLRTTAINQAIIIGYLLGLDPQKLAAWYRGE